MNDKRRKKWIENRQMIKKIMKQKAGSLRVEKIVNYFSQADLEKKRKDTNAKNERGDITRNPTAIKRTIGNVLIIFCQ